MYSKTLLTSAAFALCAVKVNSQNTANVEASDVEAIVPANVIDPAEVS